MILNFGKKIYFTLLCVYFSMEIQPKLSHLTTSSFEDFHLVSAAGYFILLLTGSRTPLVKRCVGNKRLAIDTELVYS